MYWLCLLAPIILTTEAYKETETALESLRLFALNIFYLLIELE